MVIVPGGGHSVDEKSRPYLKMMKDRCVEVSVVSKNNHKNNNKRKTKETKEFETRRRKVLGE